MIHKLKVAFFAVLLIFLFPQKAKASQSENTGNISYISYDLNGTEVWKIKTIYYKDGYSLNDKCFKVFEAMFADRENIGFIPEATKLLTAQINGGHLVLNVSKHIRNYGGSYYEICLKKQVIKTALDIEGINKVTLLIEGTQEYLPEGSYIKEETTWKETEGEALVN